MSQPDADPDELVREALATFTDRNELKGCNNELAAYTMGTYNAAQVTEDNPWAPPEVKNRMTMATQGLNGLAGGLLGRRTTAAGNTRVTKTTVEGLQAENAKLKVKVISALLVAPDFSACSNVRFSKSLPIPRPC